MDEFKGRHIPAFGSWDCDNHLPFTQCFESARQAGLLGYGYGYGYPQDRDLYVAGDLYENNVVTPAMIVVPRRRRKAQARKGKKDAWVVCNYDHVYEYEHGGKEPPNPVVVADPAPQQPKGHVRPKAVDEDLYKISPELLRATRRRRWGLFSRCMTPDCVM